MSFLTRLSLVWSAAKGLPLLRWLEAENDCRTFLA